MIETKLPCVRKVSREKSFGFHSFTLTISFSLKIPVEVFTAPDQQKQLKFACCTLDHKSFHMSKFHTAKFYSLETCLIHGGASTTYTDVVRYIGSYHQTLEIV